ncbi:MAG: TRL-like family protein [bacterium]|nr:TRL-like family protein [bacterium]
MKKFSALAVAFAIAVAIACSGNQGYSAPGGSLLNNTVLHTTGQDGLQGGPTDLGSKTGEACTGNILGIIASGDAGVKAAAAAGGITTVKGIDFRNDNLWSIMQNTCTIVHGD